jgi:hypothetical protein
MNYNLIIVFLIVFAALASHGVPVHGNTSFPLCGTCWCAPDNNGTAACPFSVPPTSFSPDVVSLFKQKTPLSIYTLSCNPYIETPCMTTPAQVPSDDSTVCAYAYSGDCPKNKYEMVTFASASDAALAGAAVTHLGACGLCSTAQDLAIYLSEDFTTAGKKCATKGVLDEATGQKCYEALGLTPECAKIWNYDGIYDGTICRTSCVTHLTDPNNGPPPQCALNECLQCDEDKAGPIFSQFAARTRRRSGLISEIIRRSLLRFSGETCFLPQNVVEIGVCVRREACDRISNKYELEMYTDCL